MKQTLTELEKSTATRNSERLQYALSIIEKTFRQSSVVDHKLKKKKWVGQPEPTYEEYSV